jgi:hypothetical protein
LADKVSINGQTAIYTGQYGVDIHCYVAEPATFAPQTRTIGHGCGFGFAQYYQNKFGKPFREDQLQLRIPQSKRDGGYFVVMVPVKKGETPPKFETIADGKAIRVIFPDRTDTILLNKDASEVELDGKKVKGTAVLITEQGEKRTITSLGQ